MNDFRDPVYNNVIHYRNNSESSLDQNDLPDFPRSSSPNSFLGENWDNYPSRSPCQCGVCGKKYKHRSSLYKHLWEHHESWETCLKYNLSKHQQVKMMEAAQVLVNMMTEKLPQSSQV
ncbi:hypothetical protein BB558_007633 [Smittium angustum]|uniref:C2H2-type domain-containing protein n=1 Tax=Smittium angustum TaxID=133377 RepID=A0A2U1IUK8_SMIAN|nr:hypothetical protein BB558_007633 [Smittium angustum]